MALALAINRQYSSVLSYHLSIIDANLAYENVQDILSNIIEINNQSSWMIGDFLVFLRFRSEFSAIRSFDWDGQNYPQALLDLIQDRYQIDLLNHPDLISGEFLLWNVIKHKRFWVLTSNNEIKLWEHNPEHGVTDKEFDNYVNVLSIRLKEALGWHRLHYYYRTSYIWPFSKRQADKSWTYHHEVVNYILAKQVGPSTNPAALTLAASELDQAIADLEANGADSIDKLRGTIKQANEDKVGWSFNAALPEKLSIISKETGELFDVLYFTGSNPEATKAILSAAGVYSRGGEIPKLTFNDDSIYDEDKRLVATCGDVTALEVAEAIDLLMTKMRWKVDLSDLI